jgi:hypothetical protein
LYMFVYVDHIKNTYMHMRTRDWYK